jgi:hypothetical protein
MPQPDNHDAAQHVPCGRPMAFCVLLVWLRLAPVVGWVHSGMSCGIVLSSCHQVPGSNRLLLMERSNSSR